MALASCSAAATTGTAACTRTGPCPAWRARTTTQIWRTSYFSASLLILLRGWPTSCLPRPNLNCRMVRPGCCCCCASCRSRAACSARLGCLRRRSNACAVKQRSECVRACQHCMPSVNVHAGAILSRTLCISRWLRRRWTAGASDQPQAVTVARRDRFSLQHHHQAFLATHQSWLFALFLSSLARHHPTNIMHMPLHL